MVFSPAFRPATSHAALGTDFYDEVSAATFPAQRIRFRNNRWAARVGLEGLTDAEWIAHFARFEPLPGSFPQPLALRYHGHQFGSYNPDLGDGRGFLFAQLYDTDGRLLDLATKGSGRTPWSRGGDGKLTLNGGIREVLATEMLEALGVNTSKSFSLIETGEALQRGDEPSPTRASVLVRLGHSHLRIGTFQRLLALNETSNIERLLDYTIATYMPEVQAATVAGRAVAFLQAVCGKVARMGAQWMVAGFVHAVLNTDNINVNGESFDYGPWRFLPTYDPGFTAAYFDHTSRYAYGEQPGVLLWNLTRLAECLLPLAPQADLEQALAEFAPAFRRAFVEQSLRRLGIAARGDERDDDLVHAFWGFLASSQASFEQVIFDCYGGTARLDKAVHGPVGHVYATDAFAPVRSAFADASPAEGLRLDHAYFAGATPCTMLHDEVETILGAVDKDDDWSMFEAKITAIRAMGEAYGREAPTHGS
ncbi:YdiU family protein [Lichenihabitans sp. PAMC28606]|uniref:protein adenylyltransferase SelO n=1 Tax=Lichenihabitans sp. PAMC28606 TaxID=2880932 RepID=UPI001D0B8A06|nr:YdiU family protein [Lichenihabitans sp. PAMC28606]UDL96319.1 YdiU family protein [Lichenihabitans sp. PAMC28606]